MNPVTQTCQLTNWITVLPVGMVMQKEVEEDADEGFLFLLQPFFPDYPIFLFWCWSYSEELIHCLNNSQSMWCKSFELEGISLINFVPLFEDLRAFYKELPLQRKTSKRSLVLEYIQFQTNLKLQSYMSEMSEVSTLFLLPFILLLCLTCGDSPPHIFKIFLMYFF